VAEAQRAAAEAQRAAADAKVGVLLQELAAAEEGTPFGVYRRQKHLGKSSKSILCALSSETFVAK